MGKGDVSFLPHLPVPPIVVRRTMLIVAGQGPDTGHARDSHAYHQSRDSNGQLAAHVQEKERIRPHLDYDPVTDGHASKEDALVGLEAGRTGGEHAESIGDVKYVRLDP